MKFKDFNKQNLKILVDEINKSVSVLNKKYGIKIKVAGGTFSDTNFKTKLTADIDNPVVIKKNEDKKKREFKEMGKYYGAKASWYGKTFKEGRYKFTVVGLNPNRPKNVIMLVREDGTKFSCPASYIKRFLK